MKYYDYITYLETNDDYGQPVLSEVTKRVKMSINFASEQITENPLYSSAQYVGLTLSRDISDKNIILFGEERLKVLYANKQGRYTQVFLARE
jgi:hypothetical protein